MRLEEIIGAYVPFNPQEEADRAVMLDVLRRSPGCLSRTDTVAHFTASAWVVNPPRTRILLVYHRLYDSWSWTGGHADGEEDLFLVARRELMEETGLERVTPVSRDLFSLEVLPVFGHEKNGAYVPSHLHLNLTWLFEADDAQPLRGKPDENSGAKWFAAEGLLKVPDEQWMAERIYAKLMARLARLEGAEPPGRGEGGRR